ncbi:MAG: YHS domain-containing (seleno)protein [Xanthobacteraceae bacterium]
MGGFLGWLVGPPSGNAATTEYIVTDRYSGLAISGFDPVAYFTDGVPALGRGEFEHRHGGVVWRFRNAGNRAAFAANPEIYAPRFGGYDAVGVARGAAVPGDPRQWIVSGERLYLFHGPENQAVFAKNADGVIAVADKLWPSVQLTLSP